nr:MAG TPA: hypothetical protein [Caudoviricetes sp.]DAZ29508.1 MAG TPA: hypothetical protein [Caudoviricetes sp.]
MYFFGQKLGGIRIEQSKNYSSINYYRFGFIRMC